MPIPLSVSRADLMKAIKPLCDLLGTNPRAFFSEPGLQFVGREIRFIAAAGHELNPTGRPESIRVRTTPPRSSSLPPHPQGIDGAPVAVEGADGDPGLAEWGYEVKVEVQW